MLRGDAPEKWQERIRPRRRVSTPLSPARRAAMFVLFVVFVAAGVAGYVYVGRHMLPASLPLPAKLKTVSSAHAALLGYGDALNGLAVDTEGRLPHPDPRGREVWRLLDRLDALTATGRQLRPRVTREESRALDAFEHGEHLLGSFILSSVRADGSFDPQVLKAARAQIRAGLEIARGRTAYELVTRELETLRRSHPSAESTDAKSPMSTIHEIQSAGQHLRLGE